MLLAFALILWVVLSAAVHVYLRQNDHAPVPIMAGLLAAGFGLAGLFQLQLPPQVSQAGGTYHDTYFTHSVGFYLLNLAITYLFASGVALLVSRLARGLASQMMAPAFWLLHIGSGAVVLPTVFARYQTPTVYADYPDAFQRLNLSSSAGGFLCFLGLAAMVILIVIVLGQRLILGRTN